MSVRSSRIWSSRWSEMESNAANECLELGPLVRLEAGKFSPHRPVVGQGILSPVAFVFYRARVKA